MVIDAFNPEQQRAIEHTFGPLRIVAGAGTGKTTTLQQRTVHLVERGLAKPAEILVLTFTNKAVAELRERIDSAVSSRWPGGERVDIDTYHAFGGRVVSEFGAVLGYPADPVVLTKAESWIILWQGVDEIGFEHIELANLRGGFGTNPLATILELGSRLSDEMLTVDDLQCWLEKADNSTRNNELRDYARALRYYQQRKRELGAIDYGDQIMMACALLDRPDVASSIGSRYRFVMVDEFQDTNFAQSVMVQRLTGGLHDNVCVVGDPNQAIYAFRGAAPDNFDRFASESFPGTKTLPLSDNYRSTQEILDLANSIWEDKSDPYRGNLRSATGASGPRPLLIEAERLDDELAYLARQIKELSADGRDYRQIAVICRKSITKRLVFDTLRRYGIPAEIVGGQSLYETPEVREIISWLRAIGDPGHDTAFAYLVLSERVGMDEQALYDIAQQRKRGESLQTTARRLVAEENAPPELLSLITTLSRLVQRSYAGLEPLMADIVGLRQSASDPIETENIERFVEVVTTFAGSRLGSPDLQDLLAFLELMLIAGPEEEAATGFDPQAVSGVTVITAHAAKGLQWPVVFIPCANANDFYNQGRRRSEVLPWELSHDEPGRPERADFSVDARGQKDYEKAIEAWGKARAKEEEFRTLYVALTRAESLLYISWAKEHPTRSTLSKIHPALADTGERCQQRTAPPAEGNPVPRTLASVAPRLLEQLAPFLTANGQSPPELISTLRQISPEVEISLENLLSAWSLFESARDRLNRQLDDFALVAAAETQPSPSSDGFFVISFTQLESWNRCPHQYLLRYVRGLPGEPKRWATQFGSDLHQALAIEAERRLLGLPTSVDSLRASFAGEDGIGGKRAPGEHDPIEAYLRSPDASAEVLLVEQPFTLRFGDVALSGIIDRVHRLPDGSTEIVDYKSNKRAATYDQIRRGLQLPIYLIACREIFPEVDPPPARAVLFNLRHDLRTEMTWTDQELAGIRNRIVTTAADMRRADPERHNASEANCRWCEYRYNCRFSQYRG